MTAKKMHLLGIHNGLQLRKCSLEMLTAHFGKAGAKLIDNVVKIDACSSAWSFVTTPLWLLTGKQQGAEWLPKAGIAEAEIADCGRFGARVAECLHRPSESDQPMLRGLGGWHLGGCGRCCGVWCWRFMLCCWWRLFSRWCR